MITTIKSVTSAYSLCAADPANVGNLEMCPKSKDAAGKEVDVNSEEFKTAFEKYCSDMHGKYFSKFTDEDKKKFKVTAAWWDKEVFVHVRSYILNCDAKSPAAVADQVAANKRKFDAEQEAKKIAIAKRTREEEEDKSDEIERKKALTASMAASNATMASINGTFTKLVDHMTTPSGAGGAADAGAVASQERVANLEKEVASLKEQGKETNDNVKELLALLKNKN